MLMSGAATVDAVPPAQVARALGIVHGIGSLGQLISAYVVALIVSLGRDQLIHVLCWMLGRPGRF